MPVQGIELLRVNARAQIEALYEDTCTVYERKAVTDAETHTTAYEETAVWEDIPCRVSFSSSPAAGEDTPPAKTQTVKLFLAPETEIKPGSRITVTRNGTDTDYEASGQPARYLTHQEITLTLYEATA